MAISAMTADEIAASLSKSALPTVLVEGSTDANVYRMIESQIGVERVSIINCQGRTVVLDLFHRRAEFSHLPVAFVCDCDMWIFSGVPSQFNDVVFTSGYSIENDVVAGSDLMALCDSADAQRFEQLVDAVTPCFAFEVEQHLAGNRVVGVASDLRIVDDATGFIKESHLLAIGFVQPNPSLVSRIRQEYKLKLRGRLLLQCLMHTLNRRGSRESTYGRANLLEMGVKLSSKPVYVRSLCDRIGTALVNRGAKRL